MVYSKFYNHFYDWQRNVNVSLKSLWYFRSSRIYFSISILLNILAWVQAILIRHNLSGDLLVLHYNVDSGVDLVGDPMQILWYPVFGLIVLIINYFLAAAWHKHKDFKFCAHLLLATALVFAAFLNLVLIFVYLVNFK